MRYLIKIIKKFKNIKVKIFFQEINSGMPQGTIIRRHRIPKPAPRDDEYYTVEDFNIGNEITFYGKLV